MRKIRDVLRLKLEARLSHERCAAALQISKGVVTKYLTLATAAGLDWSQVQLLDDTALHSRLLGIPPNVSVVSCNPTMAVSTRSCAARA